MVTQIPAGTRITDGKLLEWSEGINDLQQPPIAVLRQTAAQSLTNGVGTAVTFGVEDVDSASGHSTSSNTSRYVSQIDGWYLVAGGVCFAANATGRRGGWWVKNGTIVSGSESIVPTHASTVDNPMRTTLVQLDAGDYVELHAFQDSGGALNTSVAAAQQHATMTIVLVYRL